MSKKLKAVIIGPGRFFGISRHRPADENKRSEWAGLSNQVAGRVDQ